MHVPSRAPRAGAVLIALAWLSLGVCAQAVEVLPRMPHGHGLAPGHVIYVENDGRCAEGQVIKVTGGDRRMQVPRTTQCVPRPAP